MNRSDRIAIAVEELASFVVGGEARFTWTEEDGCHVATVTCEDRMWGLRGRVDGWDPEKPEHRGRTAKLAVEQTKVRIAKAMMYSMAIQLSGETARYRR